jgi:DNA-binding transcriptional regulator YbjK
MKPLFLCLLASAIASLLQAQTVTLQFAGITKNRQYEVVIDSASYFSADAVGNGKSKMLTMNNLSLGLHELTLYAAGTTTKNQNNALYSKSFQLRKGYDLDIVVNANGEVSFTEKQNTQSAVSTGTYNAAMAMSSTDFDHLAQSVRSKLMQSARIATLRTTFAVPDQFFSTDQISQLLSYVNSEPKRLELAKAAYARVVDSDNYRTLYELFASESLKNELDFFLRNTTISPGAEASTSTPPTTKIDTTTGIADSQVQKAKVNTPSTVTNQEDDAYSGRTPVSNKTYNQLLRKERNQRTQQGKVALLTSAFQREGSYYTTEQLRKLLTPVTTETDRVTLAKLAYNRTADTANFKTLYDLFNDRYSQMELDHFIRYGNVGTTVTTSASAYAYRVPISDATYSQLDLKVQFQLRQPDMVAEIKKAFSSNHYFTAEQIRQWLSLVTAETDRLALAKLAYLRITDPTNFPSLYDLFPSEESREELERYVTANKY